MPSSIPMPMPTTFMASTIFAAMRSAMRRQVPIYADRATMARIREGFSYCLETPEGSQYPPIVTPHLIEDGILGLTITGAGGPIRFIPIPQIHGSIKSLGYRIGNFAYCCDISGFPDESLPRLKDLDVLIIDALQYKSHPSHLSLSEALDCIAGHQAEAGRADPYAHSAGLRGREASDAGSRGAGL
jgi:phosphoribosyl 1,2-cyclic phosphodiesterase